MVLEIQSCLFQCCPMLKMGSDVGGQFRNNFFVPLLTHTRLLAKTEKISPVPDPLMMDYDKSVA